VASCIAESHPRQAKKLGKASNVIWCVGFILPVVVLIIGTVVWLIIASVSEEECPFRYNGFCHNYRSYVGSSGSCDFLWGTENPDGYCYFYYNCPGVVYNQGCYAFKIQVGNVSNCTGVGIKSPDDYCYYADCPYYTYNGTCYRNKTYVGSSDICTGDISPSGYCYYTYCPSRKFPTECYKYKTRHFRTWNTSRCAVIANDRNDNNASCYSNTCNDYEYRGSCYKYRDYVGNSNSCTYGVTSLSGYCYTICPHYYYAGFCYNNKVFVNSTDNCTGVRSPYNYCYFD